MASKMKAFVLQHKWELLVFGIVFLLRIAFFHICLQPCYTVDSEEFRYINGLDCLLGSPDRYRLPLYPFLIDVLGYLFGASHIAALFWLQLIVSLLSSLAMYAALRKLSSRKPLCLTVTVLYSLCATVIYWDKTVLTESLSLSLTVFMLCGLVGYLKDGKLLYLAMAVAAAGLGAFTRAVFAIYAGLIFGFLILRLIFPGTGDAAWRKARRIKDLKGLAIAIVPVVLLLVYAASFCSNYGAFTLSDSSLGQQLSVVLQEGYYQDASDEELKTVAEEILQSKLPLNIQTSVDQMTSDLYGDTLTEEQEQALYDAATQYLPQESMMDEKYLQFMDEYYVQVYGKQMSLKEPVFFARAYLLHNYDRQRLETFVDEAKAANTGAYLRYLLRTTSASLFQPYFNVADGDGSYVIHWFLYCVMPDVDLHVIHGLLIGLAELIAFMVILKKKRNPDWLHLGLAAFLLSTTLLSMLGTNAEFGRTAVTAYPMLLLSFAICADRLAKRMTP